MQNNDLYRHCYLEPREYTYIGIGSKNRYDDLTKFSKDIDQIFPVFLDKIQTTIRIIHFDPRFEEDNGFLEMYFERRNIRKVDTFIWLSEDQRIEVIINPVMFEDNNFLHRMMKLNIELETKLVVQQYTGRELGETFKLFYNSFLDMDKEYIEKNILFDFTYGDACHCDTPMLKYEPLVDKNGDFYNFTLFNEEKMFDHIGINSRMDDLIEKYVKSKLSRFLNETHVNYRKATRREEHMFSSQDYPSNAEPDVIMDILLTKVRSILDILKKLGKLTREKEEIFTRCSQNYLSTDLYKWYSEMTKLYK